MDSKQQTHKPEFVKCLADFFHRTLISIPVVKNYPHQSIFQRCGLKAATLELDTAAYPNIEYLAGTRLSVYPLNPNDHVQVVLKHLIDDVGPSRHDNATPNDAGPAQKKAKLNDEWAKFVQLNGKDSLRLALVYLYDITMAPSRDLVRVMAECCSNKEHKARLISISQTEESWEKWICSAQRTLKSTFEEFNSCKLSAKSLFSELSPQQPRQYSISSIRSSKRFRAEIIVFQHKFSPRQIEQNLQNIRDRELLELRALAPGEQQTTNKQQQVHGHPTRAASSNITKSGRSLRSMRSVTAFSSSPISTHQVHQVPHFSGPLMSMYANSTMSSLGGPSSGISSSSPDHPSSGTGGPAQAAKNRSGSSSQTAGHRRHSSGLAMSSRQEKSMMMSTANSLLSQAGTADMKPSSKINLVASPSAAKPNSGSAHGKSLMFDGLCSNYLLNLNTNDHLICEFVENPRFTLKGNRERPILMIGQDVGVVAFRPFWQQRCLEHDRAQIFYTLFKDLAPKKFGDMRLVCLTGNRCKIEELFRREMNHAQVAKILSSVSYINRSQFASLLDVHAIRSLKPQQQPAAKATKQHGSSKTPTTVSSGPNIKIESKELIELGNVIYKLLIEQNGCLYTCCDPQLTQAIEILTVESIARNNNLLSRERIMTLLPHWKGRGPSSSNSSGHLQGSPTGTTGTMTPATNDNNKYLFTLENQFEKSMIVQEIYDASI